MVGFCGIQQVLLWPATTKNPMSHGWQCMLGCDLPSITDGGCLGYLGDFTVVIQPLDRIPYGSQCMPEGDLPTALGGGFLGNPGDFIMAIQPLNRIPCPTDHNACLVVTYPLR